jgi:hypothetical protein
MIIIKKLKMGLDVEFIIRLIDPVAGSIKEVRVSEQDNSLQSIFYNTNVKYTSITFDIEAELTEEEQALFRMDEEEEDMMGIAPVVEASAAVLAFEKINKALRKRTAPALVNDLAAIEKESSEPEEVGKRKRSKVRDYLDFDSSFNIMYGVLKSAAAMSLQVQLVAAYY